MADTEPRTIVITGASSGIGKSTARLFFDKGWNVVATMRNPAAEKDLKEQARLKLIALDVQDPEGPKAAVAEAIKAYGRIDAWLNNAGYGAFGPVEAGTRKEIERQFDVNVFGLIACVQAVAPHFRERKAGVLINVSSIGGIMTVPAYAVYNATKFAVEGLSEGLWYELGTFGVKVKVIEPGAIKTEFGGRSQDVWDVSRVPAYAPFMDKVNATRAQYITNSSTPELVAEVIYQAATDPSDRMRYPAGPDARRFIPLRRLLGAGLAMKMIKQRFKLQAGPSMLERFSSDGVDIAFIDAKPRGRDLGEPILLIHGFASNHRINWVNPRWVETLTEAGRRVVAYDNRGHGQSEKLHAPADYGAELMTRDAANLLEHLGIERADVMGYSMGARIASYLALGQPGLVRSLILGGLGDRLLRDAGLPEAIAEAMEASSLESLADPTQRLFRAFADQNKSDRAALAACVRGYKRSLAPEEAARIAQPTLVAVGERDVIAGDPLKLAGMLPQAKVFPIPGRDHNLAVGDKAFKAAALDFLQRRE